MTLFFVALIVSFLFFSCLGIIKAIIRPIFEFIYYSIISQFTSNGISFLAAKAIISVIIIIIILSIIF